jgi:hypothetical protein
VSPFTGRQTITTVTRVDGVPDPLGVPARVETHTQVAGCSVQPLATVEDLSNVDTVISRWRLFAPIGTTLSATDGVIADGVLYEVDGDPQPWTDQRGRPHHLECLLRRATG